MTSTDTPVRKTSRPTLPAGVAGLRLRPLIALLLLIATCWAAVLLTLPARSGDPVLIETSPIADKPSKSLDEVRLTFDQPVPGALATIRVTGPFGDSLIAGRPYNPADMPDTIAVALPDTRYGGTYSVAWSVPTSRGDVVEGRYRFQAYAPTAVVTEPVLPTGPDPVVAAVHTGFRVITLLAFVVLVGLAFGTAVGSVDPDRDRTARRLAVGAWWALAGGTVLVLLTYGGYAARTSLLGSLDPALVPGAWASDTGAGLRARLFALVPATVGLALLLDRAAPATRAARWVRGTAVLGSAAALAVTWSVAGPHEPGGPAVATAAASGAVLLLAAVTVGGVLAALRTGQDGPVSPLGRTAAAVLLAAVAAAVTGPFQAAALTVAALVAVGSAWAPARRGLPLVAAVAVLVAVGFAGSLDPAPALLSWLPGDPVVLALRFPF